jgi:Fur family ferric uptake transcriptional regulator
MSHNRPVGYRTRQGEDILNYLKSLEGAHVTVGAISRHFAGLGRSIGQATVYRRLEKLAAEGIIRKYLLSDGRSACYQYLDGPPACREHFHLLCESCGALIHADCEVLDTIAPHLLREHEFRVNMLKTVFYGICEACLSATPGTGKTGEAGPETAP